MSERVVKLPGPAHPITTEANPARVVVCAGGRVIADSVLSLTLREASYPAVHYIPRADVDMAALTRSDACELLPLQGRGHLLQHRGSDGRHRRRGLELRGPVSRRWQGSGITSPSTRTAWTASPSSRPIAPQDDRRKGGPTRVSDLWE